jgi:hypothetical protein
MIGLRFMLIIVNSEKIKKLSNFNVMNYRIDRNNYHQKPKSSNIQTPLAVSQFIFELLRDKIIQKEEGLILDPCSGKGNLLRP